MKTKIIPIILFVLFCGCKNTQMVELKETRDYIEWLGDRATDMSIGGDADAYRTLEWAEKHDGKLTKKILKEKYESYEIKRQEKNECREYTTVDYEWHCDGYWYTFTHDGKIYNCLPQVPYAEMTDEHICYDGEKYVCHVNSDDITKEKIKKSCEWNKKIKERFAGHCAIPKRMEKQ